MWRKTPAGDEAAAACPADASGGTMTGICFVCPPLTCLCVGQLPSGRLEITLSLLTGLILRRCSLDAVGLASWESPTHVKCVSKNYENIQTLVRPERLTIPDREVKTGSTKRSRLTS